MKSRAKETQFNTEMIKAALRECDAAPFSWEYRLVYRMFMSGHAPRKIAREFNISRQRVHDIVKIYRRQVMK